ncbi:MAG: GNAT family N-acetyltransferase [Sulfurovum sp.]|nr:GNAT family N-acetyltransferase [Sulfurovum sp.]
MQYKLLKKNALSVIEYEIYKNLYDNSSVSTPFHNISFLEILEKIRKSLVLTYLILYKDNNIIAIMPYFSHRNFLNLSMTSLPYGCYGGFLYKDQYKEEISVFLKQNKFISLVSIINSYKDSIYNNLKYFKEKKYSTWVIDTKPSYTDIFQGLHSKTRNQIRKSIKSSINIRDMETIEEVESIVKIYSQLVKKHEIKKPYINQIFYELFFASLKDNNIIFKIAEYEDKIIAYSIFLRNQNQLFYWMNASDSGYAKLNATNGVLNFMLEFASEDDNIEELNLGAIPYDNTGLYHFKNRWNAMERAYYSYHSFVYNFIKKV